MNNESSKPYVKFMAIFAKSGFYKTWGQINIMARYLLSKSHVFLQIEGE